MQEEVAEEAETGMMYKPNYHDKYGRSVLVMRPCVQVSSENHFQYLSSFFIFGTVVFILFN